MGENNAKEEGLKFQFSLRYFDWNFLLKKILKSSTYCSRTPLHLLHSFQLKLFLSLLLNIHKRILLFIARKEFRPISAFLAATFFISLPLSLSFSLSFTHTHSVYLYLSLSLTYTNSVSLTHTLSLSIYISLSIHMSPSHLRTHSLSLSLYLYISVT